MHEAKWPADSHAECDSAKIHDKDTTRKECKTQSKPSLQKAPSTSAQAKVKGCQEQETANAEARPEVSESSTDGQRTDKCTSTESSNDQQHCIKATRCVASKATKCVESSSQVNVSLISDEADKTRVEKNHWGDAVFSEEETSSPRTPKVTKSPKCLRAKSSQSTKRTKCNYKRDSQRRKTVMNKRRHS